MSKEEVEKDPQEITAVNPNLTMTRGTGFEVVLDFNEIRDYVLYDAFGGKVKFGELFSKKKTIVVFVRHFLCYICKEYVEDLAKIPDSVLDEANIQLVVIGCAKPRFIEQFCETTGYNHQMYSDPELGLYKKMECIKEMKSFRNTGSKHIKSGFLMGFLKSTWRAMNSETVLQGDVDQQGGSFILGPGEVCHYSHIDHNSSDHSNINDLLEAAGACAVSFEKDRRVLTV